MKFHLRTLALCSVFCTILFFSETANAQGVLFRGVGAVNESFGGASTAAPLDSAGAIYWNPASISGLQHSEMQFGMGIVMSETELSSTYGPASGKTEGSAGSIPAPSASMVWKMPNKRWTLGFMFAGIGGASTMYPADSGNPIMLAAGGTRTSNVQIIQVLPTVSYQLTKRLSLGITPTLDVGKLEIHPSAIAGSSEPTGTRYIWGAGVNAGLFYQADNCFNYGFTSKSPQWIEKVMVYDSQGSHYLDLDLPLILSTGVSYTGFRDTVFAVDFRYFDWGNTPGFRDAGFDAAGNFVGLGWQNIFSVAMGVERKISDRLKLRMGYCFNENPIKAENSMYNVASPLLMEHTVSCGASWTFAREWDLAIAYTHAFQKDITGPFVTPYGTGTVTNSAAADILNASVIKRF